MPTLARLVLATYLALLVSCGPAPSASAPPAAPAKPAPTAPAAPAETAPRDAYDTPVWRELIEAARREGKLVLASGPTPATRQNLPRAFKDRFGIEIEYLGGRSSDLQT